MFLLAALLPAQLRRTTIIVKPTTTDSAVGEMRYLELRTNGTNYSGFKAATSMAGNIVWSLPAVDSTGTQCFASNGSLVLSFVGCSGASVGLINEVQMSDGSGGFLASSSLTHTAAAGLEVGGTVNIFSSSSDGRITIDNNSAVIMIELAEGTFGGAENTGALGVKDSGGTAKLILAYDAGGDPHISLIESGAGSAEEIRLEARASGNGGDSIIINNDAGTNRISMGVAGSGLDAIIFLTDSEAETVVLKSDDDDAFTGLFVNGDRVVQARQTGPSAISCTPGETYGTTEQTCIEDLVTALNLLRTALGTSGHGMVTSP